MNGAKIGVFEESNKVSLSCFLKGEDSLGLEADVILHFHSNISNKSLEGEFSDQQISSLLIFPDLSEGNCARSELVGFLHSSACDGSWLSCGLGGELFSRSLNTCGLSSGLFSSSHFWNVIVICFDWLFTRLTVFFRNVFN